MLCTDIDFLLQQSNLLFEFSGPLFKRFDQAYFGESSEETQLKSQHALQQVSRASGGRWWGVGNDGNVYRGTEGNNSKEKVDIAGGLTQVKIRSVLNDDDVHVFGFSSDNKQYYTKDTFTIKWSQISAGESIKGLFVSKDGSNLWKVDDKGDVYVRYFGDLHIDFGNDNHNYEYEKETAEVKEGAPFLAGKALFCNNTGSSDKKYAKIPGCDISPSEMPDCTITIGCFVMSKPTGKNGRILSNVRRRWYSSSEG